jgi:hypothetical protein
MFDLAYCTFLLAFLHFGSELFIFRTLLPKDGALGPLIVACKLSLHFVVLLTHRYTPATTLVWMFVQYNYYVRPSQ